MNSETYNKYSTKLDPVVFLTVICLLTVLLLHHATYTLDYLSPVRPFYVHKFLQKFAVGGFIFLSGFKLAKSKISTPVREFIVNRFLKIYLLYLMSLIIFSFTVYPSFNNGILPSWKNFVLHAIGLQSIFPNIFESNYHTIWFVSVIFICYVFFLLSRNYLKQLRRFFLLSLVICLTIPVIRHISSLFSINIFQNDLEIWLSIFSFGMAYADLAFASKIDNLGITKLSFAFCFGFTGLIAIYSSHQIMQNFLFYIMQWILVLIAVLATYFLIFRHTVLIPHYMNSFLKWVAYSSFCIFLFHRPVWTILLWVWNERTFFQSLFVFFIGIPIIFILSYITQTFYNQVVVNTLSKLQS